MEPMAQAKTNAAATPAAARLEGVALRYEVDAPPVLRNLDLTVPDGAFRYLVGPSGAGKSSLLRLIFLDVRPTAGRISLFGESTVGAPPERLARLRRRIGVVFQDFKLLDGLSLVDNIALPRLISGADLAETRKEATELIHWVGLADRIDAAPAGLSGGERQRAAIARAVIGRPSLIVADEPTGSVDDAMADRLLTLLQEMNRNGAAVVLATHSTALIDRFPHPVVRLVDGQAVEDGAS